MLSISRYHLESCLAFLWIWATFGVIFFSESDYVVLLHPGPIYGLLSEGKHIRTRFAITPWNSLRWFEEKLKFCTRTLAHHLLLPKWLLMATTRILLSGIHTKNALVRERDIFMRGNPWLNLLNHRLKEQPLHLIVPRPSLSSLNKSCPFRTGMKNAWSGQQIKKVFLERINMIRVTRRFFRPYNRRISLHQ